MKSTKSEKYERIQNRLNEVYSFYKDLTLNAQMACVSSAVKNEFSEFTFVGFYVVINPEILEIGPYVSGILAVPRILFGKGVCGTCWEKKETQIVNNVKKCDNYIACSPDVLSEIVLPVFNQNNEVIAVLDIDSKELDRFDEEDKIGLQNIIDKYCVSR